ncbi:hypothetical protein AB0I91_13695 [Actinosynnema sp. NPDC049800]
MLKERLGEITTNVGRVAICEVDTPYLEPKPWERTYAAVVIDPAETYKGPEVGMIITVLDERFAPREYHEFPKRGWDPCVRTVKDVYRDEAFYMSGPDTASAAVRVGQFLLQEKAFVRHSTSRTRKGSEWAKKVGGEIPDSVDLISDASSLDRHSRAALKRLQDDDWWRILLVNPLSN